MELAILRLMTGYIGHHSHFVLKPGSLKVVYLAPIRALVQEKVKQWQHSFGSKLGLTCCELTGDSDVADSLHLDNADIICTTPEKFGRSACWIMLDRALGSIASLRSSCMLQTQSQGATGIKGERGSSAR